jgi:hypothetical protein
MQAGSREVEELLAQAVDPPLMLPVTPPAASLTRTACGFKCSRAVRDAEQSSPIAMQPTTETAAAATVAAGPTLLELEAEERQAVAANEAAAAAWRAAASRFDEAVQAFDRSARRIRQLAVTIARLRQPCSSSSTTNGASYDGRQPPPPMLQRPRSQGGVAAQARRRQALAGRAAGTHPAAHTSAAGTHPAAA